MSAPNASMLAKLSLETGRASVSQVTDPAKVSDLLLNTRSPQNRTPSSGSSHEGNTIMARDFITERRAELHRIIRDAQAELVDLEHAEWLQERHEAAWPSPDDWRLYCEAAEAGAFDVVDDDGIANPRDEAETLRDVEAHWRRA